MTSRLQEVEMKDTNQASEYQGNEPTYRVDKEKGKYVIRKEVR